jgi:metacaspase-1
MAKLALCMGINDYPGTGSDLAGCVNDAHDWAQALKDRGFAVATLLDRQATGQKMKASMKDVITRAEKGDTVVIQYSGHGSYVPDAQGDEPDGFDECLCPYDIKAKGPITDDDLFQIFDSRKSGVTLVMVSDSCHSGTVTRFAPISTPPTTKGKNAPQRKVKFLPASAFLSESKLRGHLISRRIRPARQPGRYAGLLMSGCQDAEFSYDAYFNGRPNGAFTFVALRALEQLSATSTYKDWMARIRASLPSQQYPQTPHLFGTERMKKRSVL